MDIKTKNQLSVVILVLGILSFVGLFFGNVFVESLCAIPAVILTVIVRKDKEKYKSAMLSIGIILSVISVISVISRILTSI